MNKDRSLNWKLLKLKSRIDSQESELKKLRKLTKNSHVWSSTTYTKLAQKRSSTEN
jgi:hypothetical protein